MMNNKSDKSLLREKEICNAIIVSNEKESCLHVDIRKPKIKNIDDNKSKLQKNSEKTQKLSENLDNKKNKSYLKMSVKMNNFFSNGQEDKVHMKGDSNCKHLHGTSTTNGSSKSEKSSITKDCCNMSSNKVVKCKANETQLRVSIKSEIPLCYKRNESIIEHSPKTVSEHQNCFKTLKEKIKVLRIDLLLQFLDQMRHKVITRELSFDTFITVSEKLMKDKMDVELLLLTQMIIRAQVIQMTKLISKDLCQNKLTPPLFVKAFLKQYQFLKSLNLVYKDILNEYESSYLSKYKLTFDLISRAYFKILMHGCPKIKEYISAGHLNVKLECIYESKMTNIERTQTKTSFNILKSDFQEKDRWTVIEKTVSDILDSPDDTVVSLVNYFNTHFTSCFCRNLKCSKECCNHSVRPPPHHDEGNYKEILRILWDLPDRDVCSISLTDPSSLQYWLKTYHEDYNFDLKNTITSIKTTTTTTTCKSMYHALENIKPPSISCSSSSNNSNGYNSCVSISSCDESSEEDDVERDEKFYQKWKRQCALNDHIHHKEETKPPTPVSLSGDDTMDSTIEVHFPDLSGQTFSMKDQSCNEDDIEKFNEICNQYLVENEHLLDKASVTSTSHMSVSDYVSTLEKADNLQSMIKKLMVNFKKNIDNEEKIPGVTLTDMDPGMDPSSTFYLPSTCTIEQKDTICSNLDDIQIKDDEFDEILKELGLDHSTPENLEGIEKFLEKRPDSSSGKAHPNLKALVKTYRKYCTKLYRSTSKDDHSLGKATESDSSEMGGDKNVQSGDSKQTVSGDESFDLPCDCLSAVNIEMDSATTTSASTTSAHDNCSSSSNATPLPNSLSYSETCSSASTENTGNNISSSNNNNNSSNNNKVCNCCKCEMFGEQNFPAISRGTNVVEKLRLKLQKRKQCQQKTQSNKMATFTQTNNNNTTQYRGDLDLDSLVEFINGPHKTNDGTSSQTSVTASDTSKSVSKRNRSKPNKASLKTKSKKLTKLTDPTEECSTKLKIEAQKDEDPRNYGDINGSAQLQEQDKKDGEKEKEEDDVPEKEVYDPVVEDFKRFCNTVVVPQHRKKLSLGTSLLQSMMDQRLQGGSRGVEGSV